MHAFATHDQKTAVTSLRRQLTALRFGAEPKIAVVREPEVWLQIPECNACTQLEDLVGFRAALYLRDGRVFVGTVERLHPASIVVRLWGTERAVRFALRECVIGSVLPAHSYTEACAVKERQREALPAVRIDPASLRSRARLDLSGTE